MKKKLFVICLALAALFCLCFGLVACGNGGGSGNGAGTEQGGLKPGEDEKPGAGEKPGENEGDSGEHRHALTKINGYEPTCTKDGQITYWVCRGCGAAFWDEAMTESADRSDYEAFEEQCKIPPTGHTPQLIEAVEPTCTKNGSTEGIKCKDCDKVILEVATVSAHHKLQQDGKCADCGESVASEGLKFYALEDGSGYALCGLGACTDTELYIPYMHEGLPVKYIDRVYTSSGSSSSGTGNDTVEAVYIPDSVEAIGYEAFEGYRAIKRLIIGDGVTEIGEKAFYRAAFEEITLGASLQKICDAGLYGDNGRNRKYVGYTGTFADWCKGIEGISEAVNRGQYSYRPAYLGLSLIKGDVVIPDGVEAVGDYAFHRQEFIDSITLPDSVKRVGEHAFSGCGASSVTFGKGLVSIGESAFNSCKNIEAVNLPEGLIAIGDTAFGNCEKLNEIVIPDSVLKIGGRIIVDTAYANDRDNWEDGILYLGKHLLFADMALLSGEVSVKDGTETIAGYAFCSYTSGNYGCEITSLILPESVKHVSDAALAGMYKLESLTTPFIGSEASYTPCYWYSPSSTATNTLRYMLVGSSGHSIPGSLKTVNVTGDCQLCDGAFGYGTGIENITLSDKVADICAGAFTDTAFYKNADNWTDGMLYIDNHLIKVDDSVTGELDIKDGTVTVARNAFAPHNFTTVNLPASLKHIGTMFVADSNVNITEINYAGDLAGWCGITGLYEITYQANYFTPATVKVGGNVLTGIITIPEGVKRIEDHAFYGITGITQIILPEDITYIGYQAFEKTAYYNSKPKEQPFVSGKYLIKLFSEYTEGKNILTINEGVEVIGSHAVNDSEGIEKIYLSSTIKYINFDAFGICPDLTDLYFDGTKEEWEAVEKHPCWNRFASFTVHCTDGDIEVAA